MSKRFKISGFTTLEDVLEQLIKAGLKELRLPFKTEVKCTKNPFEKYPTLKIKGMDGKTLEIDKVKKSDLKKKGRPKKTPVVT